MGTMGHSKLFMFLRCIFLALSLSCIVLNLSVFFWKVRFRRQEPIQTLIICTITTAYMFLGLHGCTELYLCCNQYSSGIATGRAIFCTFSKLIATLGYEIATGSFFVTAIVGWSHIYSSNSLHSRCWIYLNTATNVVKCCLIIWIVSIITATLSISSDFGWPLIFDRIYEDFTSCHYPFYIFVCVDGITYLCTLIINISSGLSYMNMVRTDNPSIGKLDISFISSVALITILCFILWLPILYIGKFHFVILDDNT